MELRITNPQENWLTEQILWNNEELKAAIAEKVKDYKTIAYTEDSLNGRKYKGCVFCGTVCRTECTDCCRRCRAETPNRANGSGY